MPVNDAHFYEYFVMLQQWCFTLSLQLSYVNSMWYRSVYSIYAFESDRYFVIPSSGLNLFFIISLPWMLRIFLWIFRWNFLRYHVRGIKQIFYDATNQNILSYDLRLLDFLCQRKYLCRIIHILDCIRIASFQKPGDIRMIKNLNECFVAIVILIFHINVVNL
jgi:hypothetical protein